MIRIVFCLLAALCLLMPAYASDAQSLPKPIAPFDDIPLNDPAYQDAMSLEAGGFIDPANWAFSPPAGTFTGRRVKTNYEFAVSMARFLNDRTKAEAYDEALRQHPEMRAAFNRLFRRFAPLIARLGVDIPAAQARLTALGHPFPDVPRDHWAYQSVETLRQAGIVVGYPPANPRAAK